MAQISVCEIELLRLCPGKVLFVDSLQEVIILSPLFLIVDNSDHF